MKQYLEVGQIVSTHGVMGEMKVQLWCDDAAFLAKFKTLYGSEQGTPAWQVKAVRSHKGMALLTLREVSGMDAARAMVGTVLYIDRKDAKLAKGRYFVQDLIGLEVRDADTGAVYGKVKSLTHPAAQDIYTVEAPDGQLYMFPGVPEFLKKLCPEEGYLLVAPIQGMFGEQESGDAQ